MRTVQMTFDEQLIQAVDKTAKQLGTSRSAFTRMALRVALKKFKIQALEQKQYQGYKKKPIQPNEFKDWENEQIWID